MTEGADRQRALRISLYAGALYDLALGLFTAGLGRWLFRVLGATFPEPAYYFYLGLLPLFVLPAIYAAAARSPDTDVFRLPVLWARFGGGGLVVLLALSLGPDLAWIFLTIGVLDGVWGAIHLALWNRRR